MPRDFKQLLEDTSACPTRPVDAGSIVRRAKRQRMVHRAAASSLAAIAVLAGVLGVISLVDSRSDSDIAFEPPPQPSPGAGDAAAAWADNGSFAAATDTVLLFDTGADSVHAVDLDEGVAARRTVAGQRPGDQPYRLWRTEDTLIVGWSEIHAVSLPTAQSRLLGEATIFVPAAEPGHVWLIDYADGRVGQGAATYRLVNLDGEVQAESPGVDRPSHFPARGVLGGLAMETEDGVAIWDTEAEKIVARFGKGNGFVSDTAGRTLVWCEDNCARLYVTDLGGDDRSFVPPEGHDVFDARSARLSPDGTLVAAIVADDGPRHDESTGSVVILEPESGEVRSVTRPLQPPPAYIAWSADGRQLFFSSYSYDASQTNVGRYVPDDGRVQLTTLPVGGALSFIPLDRDEANVFLEDAQPLPGRVPDVEGLALADAQAAVEAAGLTGRPVSGPGWADPSEPEAMVVHQEPPAGTVIGRGEVVGFRTALVTAELCEVFTRVPPREGDAHDLARTDGYWEMLEQAQPLADQPLRDHIDQLLAHRRAGMPIEEAPTRAIESITTHHDACSKGAS